MIVLAVDTSEARGSVAVVEGGACVCAKAHADDSDYSEWLLRAAEEVLAGARMGLKALDLLAVATGPGSFTGLRVGLTTVKAWVEVYAKPVVGVSRLEALARSRVNGSKAALVACCYDAQRGQIFGALYSNSRDQLQRVEDEMVIAPADFLEWVGKRAAGQRVNWVSLDPELITALPGWEARAALGDSMNRCAPELAPQIGRLAEERARAGQFTDPLELDANYVRRSDAEIFWKGR